MQASAGMVLVKPTSGFSLTLQFAMAVQRSLFSHPDWHGFTFIKSASSLVLYFAGSELGLPFPETPERTKPKDTLLVAGRNEVSAIGKDHGKLSMLCWTEDKVGILEGGK